MADLLETRPSPHVTRPNLVVLGQTLQPYVRRSAGKVGLASRLSMSFKVIGTDFLLVIHSNQRNCKITRVPLSVVVKFIGMEKNCDFRPKSPFISDKVLDSLTQETHFFRRISYFIRNKRRFRSKIANFPIPMNLITTLRPCNFAIALMFLKLEECP